MTKYRLVIEGEMSDLRVAHFSKIRDGNGKWIDDKSRPLTPPMINLPYQAQGTLVFSDGTERPVFKKGNNLVIPLTDSPDRGTKAHSGTIDPSLAAFAAKRK